MVIKSRKPVHSAKFAVVQLFILREIPENKRKAKKCQIISKFYHMNFQKSIIYTKIWIVFSGKITGKFLEN